MLIPHSGRNYGTDTSRQRHDHARRPSDTAIAGCDQRASGQYGLDPKTVAKWKKRAFVHDAPMGPKQVRSSVLTRDEEAIAVAFRKHALLPLDDCLYALQATIPHLTRSSLHRCYQRHGISRLPEIDGEKQPKKKFKAYPIGFFHIDIAEVRTEEGKLHLSLPSTEHPSLSSPSWSIRPTPGPPAPSSTNSSRPSLTRSARF